MSKWYRIDLYCTSQPIGGGSGGDFTLTGPGPKIPVKWITVDELGNDLQIDWGEL